MTCAICIGTTPELQTLNRDGVCPRCHTPHALPGARIVTPLDAWQQTYKLKPTGDAMRDRLIAARLSLRSAQ